MNARTRIYLWRSYVVYTLLVAALAALFVRLVWLQLDAGDHGHSFLKNQGAIRVLRSATMPVARGEILDRSDRLLAYSTPVQSVWINPREFVASSEEIDHLASVLQISSTLIESRSKSSGQFVYLRRQLQPSMAEEIRTMNLSGVNLETEYKRYYPAAEFASHLVGFTNIDDQGQEGLELAFDDLLTGQHGRRQVMRNALGETIQNIRLLEAPEQPGSLQLSIDMSLQYIAYRELKAAVSRHNASTGSLVLLDVQTGEVLALVNQPGYNVNDRRQLLPERTRNRALIDVFEPGSTVKPFTMAAVMEHSRKGPASKINTAPGHIRLDDKTFLDARDYGELTMTEVLAKSSQVGTIKLAMDVSASDLRDTFSRVGFGEYCATGFPGEQVGYLPNHRRWEPVQQAALSFGHGMAVNTLQLARAYGVLAADGLRRPVSLLKKSSEHLESERTERVLDSSTARAVRDMMASVVDEGTGKAAAIPGYSVAGKTGTSHRVGAGGYRADSYRATFAGMAPASNPRLVAVVTIGDPKSGQYFGGEVTAPVFSEVMAAALRILAVSPDRPQELGIASSQLAQRNMNNSLAAGGI